MLDPTTAIEDLVAARVRPLEERVARLEEELRGRAAAVWITQPEAARRAGVSVSTIRRWQDEGRLRRGLRARVCVEELLALVAGEDAPVPADAPVSLRDARIERRARALATGAPMVRPLRPGGPR